MAKQGYQSLTLDNQTMSIIDEMRTPVLNSRAAVVRDLVYRAQGRKRGKR